MKSDTFITSLVLGYMPSVIYGTHVQYVEPRMQVIRDSHDSKRFHAAIFNPEEQLPTHHPLSKRASPDAPNGYIPTAVTCPYPLPIIRNSSSLSPNETSWLSARRSKTTSSFKALLQRIAIDGFDTNGFFNTSNDNDLPTLGIALSGGGYRAMLNGAGAVKGFDDRTDGSTDTGKGGVGGVLQAATYLSGLSGGSWMMGSMYVQNFSSVSGILSGDPTKGVWELDQSIFEGPDDTRRLDYYGLLHDTVKGKQDAGWETTITDLWGGSLSYQLINPANGGPAYTFSSIANNPWFTEAQAPIPLIVSVQRPPNTLNVTLKDPVFEFNPWEMGSYDTAISAYAPLQFIGSTFQRGVIREKGGCVRGYDNAGFIMGTSSSLFNGAFLAISKQDDKGRLKAFIEDRLEKLGNENRDVAWWPNPFRDYENTLAKNQNILTLVDGGMAFENIPFHPLLWEERNVDVIIAIDSSADTNNWPNGTAMVATYQRSQQHGNDERAANPFPKIPSQNTFVNKGLNNKPTFFGCPSEYTPNVDMKENTPFVIYLPNSPYSYMSNFSTTAMSYSDNERDDIITNGLNVVTRGQGKVDNQWPQCLACGIILRALQRRGIEIPNQCGDCFKEYCWNGEVDDATPEGGYEPKMELSAASRVAGGRERSLWVILGIWTFIFSCG